MKILSLLFVFAVMFLSVDCSAQLNKARKGGSKTIGRDYQCSGAELQSQNVDESGVGVQNHNLLKGHHNTQDNSVTYNVTHNTYNYYSCQKCYDKDPVQARYPLKTRKDCFMVPVCDGPKTFYKYIDMPDGSKKRVSVEGSTTKEVKKCFTTKYWLVDGKVVYEDPNITGTNTTIKSNTTKVATTDDKSNKQQSADYVYTK